MNCKYHKDIKGNNTCSVCGEWICENCVLEIDGRIYCKDCLKSKLKNDSTSFSKSYIPEKSKPDKTYKSSLFTFLLSICLPGSSQMYLGYTKRGLVILSLFMLGFYIEAFSPLILITYVFGLFDAFKLKGNLEKGIYQEDNVTDIKIFIKENKLFMFVLGLIILVPMIFDFFDDFFDGILDILFFKTTRYINGDRIFLDISNLENILKLGITGLFIIIILIFIVKYLKNNKHNDKNK